MIIKNLEEYQKKIKEIKEIYGQNVSIDFLPNDIRSCFIVNLKTYLGKFSFLLPENELKKPFCLECKEEDIFNVIKKLIKGER